MKFAHFPDSKALTDFCHELSKPLNIPASKIKHTIARINGHRHVSSLVSEIDSACAPSAAIDIRLSASGWQKVVDRFSDTEDHSTTMFLATKKILSLIFSLVDANRHNADKGYSGQELLALIKPGDLILASLSLYTTAASDEIKVKIKTLIGNLPGLDFERAITSATKGETPKISIAVLDHLGYLTMTIEYSIRNFHDEISSQLS